MQAGWYSPIGRKRATINPRFRGDFVLNRGQHGGRFEDSPGFTPMVSTLHDARCILPPRHQ